MPVDTLFPLGTSPPTLNLFYALGQFPYSSRGVYMQSFTQLTCRGLSDNTKPLRSCLRVPTVVKADEYLCTSENPDDTPASPITAEMADNIFVDVDSGPTKKRVSFADSKGLKLHTVRIMDGPSDSPPLLLHHNLMSEVIQDAKAEATHPYTYVPDFDQPAADYLAFRERLERQNVCLESVMIKDNITILGTVKVKNIAFDKSLKVRASFDEWHTYRDFPCSYVFPAVPEEEQGACAPNKFDTFSFEFDLPPNLAGRAAYFCLWYKCSGQDYWDNNKGINYRIVSLQEKEASEQMERMRYPGFSGEYSWDEFSPYGPSSRDNERPYW